MSAEFRMGSIEGEHLSITLLGREHAGADDLWDVDWVISTISVAVGGFTGHVRASLRMDEIHRFNEGLGAGASGGHVPPGSGRRVGRDGEASPTQATRRVRNTAEGGRPV
jgi:hypothetical protein